MKRKWLLVSCAITALSSFGCGSRVSTNPNDYIGEYVFMPNNAGPGDFASFIILKDEHTAFEVRFIKESGQVLTSQKNWYLNRGTNEEVVIDKRAYPIERSHSSIHLAVNEVGQYYEKVR